MDVDPYVQASLEATMRCRQSGDPLKAICIGHVDYFDVCLVWSWHFGQLGYAYRLVPYDHPAPEVIERVRVAA